MIQLRIFFMAAITALLFSTLAHAQESSVSSPQNMESLPEKKQSINFEDELIEGTAQKPEFFYLFQKKNFNYKRLIKLRENFLPEMKRSAENIQRLRGGR